MKIGDLEIHLLTDGVVHVDAGGAFGLVPRALYGRYFEPDEDNLIPQTLTCMLVRSEGKNILIDTGLGDKLSDKERALWRLERKHGGLLDGLTHHGLSPEDIDVVIDTHLHSDHCGGNTGSEAGEPSLRFPQATYVVQRIEWAQASHPDARTRGTYRAENFEPVLRRGRLKLLHGDVIISRHVRCVATPGHTRGHQSIVLSSGDWRGLFVADMASYAVHMERTAWLTAYDVLPLENIRTKERWQQWAIERGAWMFFQHEPFTPVAQLVPQDGGIQLQPVEAAEALIAEIPIRPPHGG